MDTFVSKFGGSSLADASMYAKVAGIVNSDPRRRIVVPSAPGKRNNQDKKITDLLYAAQEAVADGLGLGQAWDTFYTRFTELGQQTGSSAKLEPRLAQVQKELLSGCSAAHAASRGEFLSGIILAHVLDYEFVDAAEVIRFDAAGRLDP